MFGSYRVGWVLGDFGVWGNWKRRNGMDMNMCWIIMVECGCLVLYIEWLVGIEMWDFFWGVFESVVFWFVLGKLDVLEFCVVVGELMWDVFGMVV